jgi:hypothetical protein
MTRAISSSFYAPEQGPTFSVYDPHALAPAGRRPDEARYGRPIAEYSVGRMTVYVYAHDIASRFTPGYHRRERIDRASPGAYGAGTALRVSVAA